WLEPRFSADHRYLRGSSTPAPPLHSLFSQEGLILGLGSLSLGSLPRVRALLSCVTSITLANAASSYQLQGYTVSEMHPILCLAYREISQILPLP
ncbi:hypothetical protein U0070_016065, partial [Myodes glareolus]